MEGSEGGIIKEQPSEHSDQIHPVKQGECRDKVITPESCCSYPELYEKEESTAIDLRTTKSSGSSEETLHSKNKKREAISIAQLLEDFYCNDSCVNRNPCSKLFLVNTIPSDTAGYAESSYKKNCNSEIAVDYSTHQLNFSRHVSGTYPETDYNHNLWSTTSTDKIVLVNQGSQTLDRERKDAAVQTVFRNIKEVNPKYSCSLCRRLYMTKNSYDRHFRTHLNNTNAQIRTNVHFSTEAKLQVYKKQVTRRRSAPIIIQMPRTSVFLCDLCEKVFSTQTERNGHNCTIEPFPMTKCPECQIKFYTLGCLKDHIGFVHKKATLESNYYYCLFCEESFNTGYLFHLHLDKHVSP